MSKISLKSILKKTFKKKPLKKYIKNVEKKPEIKSENLRISKSNEVKPEIKKVKKQETEKREYKIKDHVVYPKHGVGQITEFKKINIGGIDVETYIIKFSFTFKWGDIPKCTTGNPNRVNNPIFELKGLPDGVTKLTFRMIDKMYQRIIMVVAKLITMMVVQSLNQVLLNTKVLAHQMVNIHMNGL